MIRASRWFSVLALTYAGASARAQEYPLAPLIARLPGGTRALAMANADMGGRGSDVLFYNPAQLAVAEGIEASTEFYTHGDLLAEFSTVVHVGSGGIGVGVQSLTFSSALAGFSGPGSLGMNNALTSSGLVVAAGYARPLLGARLGANVKLLEQDVGTVRDTRGSLDVGLAYDLWNGTAGLSLEDMGPPLRTPVGTASQPTRANLGFSSGRYVVGPLDVDAAATLSLLRGRSFVAGGGGEVSYSWSQGYSVAARAGLRRPAEGEGPWTAGAALKVDRFTIEYAFETRDGRPGANRIGVAIR